MAVKGLSVSELRSKQVLTLQLYEIIDLYIRVSFKKKLRIWAINENILKLSDVEYSYRVSQKNCSKFD